MKTVKYKVEVNVDDKGGAVLTMWMNENGVFHREDGPAKEWANGTKEWWLNGSLHNEKGPAVVMNGVVQHFLNGKFYTKEDWIKKTTKAPSLNGTRFKIGDKEYLLEEVLVK